MANALTRILTQALAPKTKALSNVPGGGGGWWPLVRESFPGAWQRNIEVNQDAVLSFHAVYACMTLIAGDIAKMRVKLVELRDGIWTEVVSPAFSPVLVKPNTFQTRIQFWESYILSKLMDGNVYVLKVRDGRGIVVGLYVLNPRRVQPLVSDDGSVYYRLSQDNMAGLESDVVVPAREIIHDRMHCLFHPLVGVSPLFANGLAATQGLSIQKNSTGFFDNNARPSGILSAPGHIDDETAARLKAHWEQNYTGGNGIGKVAVLGSDLKFQPMTMTAVDAQLVDQLKWSAQVVCSAFKVPPYKISIGEMPKYDNIQSLNVEYYSQALQYLIESAELCMDEALGIGVGNTLEGGRVLGVEFEIETLMRMDSGAQMEVLKKSAGVLKIDEMRKSLSYPPLPGGAGNDVFLQEQNYSLAALAKRDALADPFGRAAPAAAPPADDVDPPDDTPDDPPEDPAQRSLRVARFASILKQKADARDRRSA